jgi:hypothetical protein
MKEDTVKLVIIVLLIICIGLLSFCIYNMHLKSSFDSVLSVDQCYNNSHFRTKEDIERCAHEVMTLKTDMESQYWGRADNRGLTYPGGPYSGSFGNPAVL